jgi:hypothetical protein
MLRKIFAPILTLISVSTLASLPLSNDLLSFSKVFLCATIAQIILYNLYRKYLEIKLENIKNERIKEYSKQGLDIKCPCHMNIPMFVPITLNQKNSFKCGECKKMVAVDITAKAFLETEIIDLDVADAAFVEVYKKIQETNE